MKYLKQPIPVDAVQWTGNNLGEIEELLVGLGLLPYVYENGAIVIVQAYYSNIHIPLDNYLIKDENVKLSTLSPVEFTNNYTPYVPPPYTPHYNHPANSNPARQPAYVPYETTSLRDTESDETGKPTVYYEKWVRDKFNELFRGLEKDWSKAEFIVKVNGVEHVISSMPGNPEFTLLSKDEETNNDSSDVRLKPKEGNTE